MVCPHLKKPKLQYILYPGVFFLLSGLTLLFLWSTIFGYIVNQNLAIRPNSNFFNIWKRTQVPPYMEVYLFNWTNPQDGHNESVKPKFTEVGPFRFKEYKEKFNYTFNANGTISFRQKKIWHFDEDASCCSLDTVITTLNAVLVTISHKTKDFSGFLKFPISMGLRAMSPDLHVRKTALELLFDGYVDNLLATMKSIGASVPEDGKFGFFHGKNDTSRDGYFNMDISTGGKGLIRRWNYASTTPYYEDSCNEIHGTTAEMYPPGPDRNAITFFSGDMCRPLKLDYEHDAPFYTVNTYRFIADKSLFDNGTQVAGNQCYCNGECMPSGVLNVSACREGSPTFISLPHFLNADPVYLQGVEGLRPDKDKHQLYQLVEPTTGLVVEASIRIQMNFHLKPIPLMPIINDVPNVMFPILWFQVSNKGPPEFADRINLLLNLPSILKTISYVTVSLSVLMIVVGLYAKRRERVSEKPVRLAPEIVPLKTSEFDKIPQGH